MTPWPITDLELHGDHVARVDAVRAPHHHLLALQHDWEVLSWPHARGYAYSCTDLSQQSVHAQNASISHRCTAFVLEVVTLRFARLSSLACTGDGPVLWAAAEG